VTLTPRRTTWLRAIAAGVAALAALAVACAAALWATLPDVGALARSDPRLTSYMRAQATRRGLPEDAYRVGRWTPLRDVSPYAVCAVLKGEDGAFFHHAGFDWGQLRRAALRQLRGRPMGGSTVTQQLARNLYLTADRSAYRKLREALIAAAIERTLPKERILELYLNVIEFGDGVWGVTAASEYYFGRSPAALGPLESAYLASLIPAPRAPLTGRNARRVPFAQRKILRQLYRSGVIDELTYAVSLADVNAMHGLQPGVLDTRALWTGRPAYAHPAAWDRHLERARPPVLAALVRSGCGLAREIEAREAAERERALASREVPR